ncbi:MAG: nucleoside hydrolase [Chloroflexota bacterium]
MLRRSAAALLALLLLPIGPGAVVAADPSGAPDAPAPWVLDSDLGVDDAIAGVLLLRDPAVRLVAITANASGLGTCAGATEAIRLLVETVGGDPAVPVGCSRAFPLDGYAAFPESWRLAAAAIVTGALAEVAGVAPAGGAEWTQPDGARVLAEALAASPQPVSILALGPLTTIATVLDASPELIGKVARIVVMGGALDVPGNIRVPGFTDAMANTRAEWNVFVDPVAFDVVLASGIPFTLVPLDATNTMLLRDRFTDALAARVADGSPAAALVAAMLGRIDYASYGEYYHWDPFAALVATDRVACRMEPRTIRVRAETGGEILRYGIDPDDFPWTGWQGAPRANIDAATAGVLEDDPAGRPVSVCMESSLEAFEQAALDLLR